VRMFNNDPKTMCRKHLLGEHGEIHKFRHNFIKKHNMNKRIQLGQIKPSQMKQRHDLLSKEMLSRGYNHNSSYEQPDINYLTEKEKELMNSFDKCKECLDVYNKILY